MIPFPIQTLILIAAGVALFRLWRAGRPSERWLQIVVAAGFLSRAILGQILFWISWARLPIARGLQLGNGLWFFAPDAGDYFHTAMATADKGPWAIVTLDRLLPSVTYVQALALSVWLFGRATSVSVLLNLFCYLGAIALIVRWTAKEPRVRTAAAVAIVALSFSPALVLWSLQPLKDTFFQFLFVAFVASCAAWQRAWSGRARWTAWIATSALLAVLLYAAAAIRWYFALVLLIAASLFLLLTAIRTAERKLPALAAAVVVAFVLSRSFVAGSGPQLTPQVRAAFTPGAFAAAMKLPATLFASVEQARVGFDRSGGGTLIHVGKRMAVTAPPPPKPARVAATTTTISTTATPPPTQPPPARVATKKKPAPAPRVESSPAKTTTSSPPTTQTLPMAPVAPAATAAPPPHPVIPQETAKSERVASPIARLLSGLGVLVLPRVVGERLGVFHIGGGRGLFWFADVDTLAFDIVLFYVVAAVALRWRAAWRNPLAWLAFTITLLLAGPLAYSVTNFGTLFRLREMVYIGLLLTPLAAAADASRTKESQLASNPA
jgi:hypothetical protein